MEMFLQLGEAGRTVLISSHILNEAEHVGSNILVIVNGKLAARGDFHAIRALMDDRPRRVRLTCTNARAVAAGLVALPGVRGLKFEDDGLVVETSDVLALGTMAPRAAQQSAARLYGIEGLDEDLESVFRYLVSR
jgi:ABC-2 type transport system ATP-binding protein